MNTTRTYTVGLDNTVRRLDDHTGPWIDVSIPIVGGLGMTCYDVMSDPNNPDRVVVVGDAFGAGYTGVMVSYNAGVTWFKPTGNWETVTTFREVWWVDSDIIWVVGEGGIVLRSLDGGLTFNQTAAQPDDSIGSIQYTSCIHALDSLTAVVAGSQSNTIGETIVYVFKTIDGGASWTILNGGNTLVSTLGSPNPGRPGGIWISEDHQELIVTTTYFQFKGTAGGFLANSFVNIDPEFTRSGEHLTWYPSYTTPTVFRHTGGVVKQLSESTDIGVTWTILRENESSTNIRGAHFYTEDDGYYLNSGTTYSTSDGGVTGTISDSSSGTALLTAVWTGTANPSTSCGCPDGYSYDETLDQCILTEQVPATLNETTYTVTAAGNLSAYGNQGGAFYEEITNRPFPVSEIAGTMVDDGGTGSLVTPLSVITNSLWGDGNALNGRLNNIGIWTDAGNNPTNEWIGFTACVQVPETRQYNIGIAADNRVRFKIDGVLIVEMDQGLTFSFNRWHVFPITLSAGQHIIELEGLNNGAQAAFGAEIYQATQAELVVMTTTGELDPVTIFSTGNQLGLPFDIGEDSGYSCPEGYALSLCEGEPSCVRTLFADTVNCECYLIANCEDGMDTQYVFIEEELDTDLIYKFTFDTDICWSVSLVGDCPDDEDPILVMVSESFTTCSDCLPVVPVLGEVCSNTERLIEPGYTAPNCTIDEIISIKGKFADSVYALYKRMKFGIETCCEYDLDKIDMKHRILELGFIYDAELCPEDEEEDDPCET